MNEDFHEDKGRDEEVLDVVDEPVSPFEVLYHGPARGEFEQRAEDIGDEDAVPVRLSDEDRDILRALGDAAGDDSGDDEGNRELWEDKEVEPDEE